MMDTEFKPDIKSSTRATFTSRKLIAAIAGLSAIVAVCALSVFVTVVPSFDKVLLSITTITMSAIGAQFLIDKAIGA